MNLKEKIRSVPNYPKEGIMFYDITTLLKDAEGFSHIINEFVKRYQNEKIDLVVGIESRGFILGGAVAHKLGVGFVPIRKKGKLPAKVIQEEYEKEYGKDIIEIHEDSINKGDKVLLLDDLIATGGSAFAACKLIEKMGGEIVECAFVIDLPFLKGKEKLHPRKVFTLVEFDSE
ncbi:MAG: adenine phosphoribosyltransferase [archaeon]|jgi:adenine phosphoribosyltransferase